jgi:predicted nucleic-acid-binding Zn-ribbon protein
MRITACPNCSDRELYQAKVPSAASDSSHNLLPGLGRWFASATFTVVVCRGCGLTRFFAAPEATAKLTKSKQWKALAD